MRIDSAKELKVYKAGYELALRVFELSKDFPPEERFALTGQIRRSSRSVCLNLREAWSKRRYEAHFISKLTDCDGENSETVRWILPKTVGTSHPHSMPNSLISARESAECSGV
jgi:four helix bundle protein